jgi:hypothetical protein
LKEMKNMRRIQRGAEKSIKGRAENQRIKKI